MDPPAPSGSFPAQIPRVTATLLEAGADPNAREEDGATPLLLAAWFRAPLAVIAALLEAEADPNARQRDGRTSLHYAATYSDNPAIIAALVEAGADPERTR